MFTKLFNKIKDIRERRKKQKAERKKVIEAIRDSLQNYIISKKIKRYSDRDGKELDLHCYNFSDRYRYDPINGSKISEYTLWFHQHDYSRGEDGTIVKAFAIHLPLGLRDKIISDECSKEEIDSVVAGNLEWWSYDNL